MSQTILHNILETKRKEVAELLARCPLEVLRDLARSAPPVRNFFAAVSRQPRGMLLNLIAEVKKASPSAGVIRPNFNPPEIALQYQLAGASAISVLTDRQYFQGSLDDLKAVRAAVDLPVLRKDFTIDAAQVYEARIAGADAVLLIAAALEPARLLDLAILATELRMTVLVEVHAIEELMQLRSMVGFPHASYSLLGINNRDLATFKIDINTTIRLAEFVAEGTPVVSESGIKTRQDVLRLKAAGVRAVLVGETFMRSPDIGAAVRELLAPGPG